MSNVKSILEELHSLIESNELKKIKKVGKKEALYTDGQMFIVLNDEDYKLGYLNGQESDYEDFWAETEEEAIKVFKDISNIGHISHTLFEDSSTLKDRYGIELKIGDKIAHIRVAYNTSSWHAEKGTIVSISNDKIQVDKNGAKSWIKPNNVLKINCD